ncbi:MAG TPA: alpha/beta fold hydrolase [Chitinophagaceae bacterium]|nr:alpha/beta fold hydrolase [Chitinophagaceae bacterium]
MTKKVFAAILLVTLLQGLHAQTKGYTPKIEPCACAFKADSSLKTTCGYLIVPENRSRPAGKTIKLPFIYVHSNNPNKKKDPVLYTTGGPGGSSLRPVRNIHRRSLIADRDFIAFEQRGTQYAVPCLNCDEINTAIKYAYRNNLPKDSLIMEAARHCRQRLEGEGIDLSAYNTVESAADIEDLRRALKIDSLNLMGISYSGGLLMTVLHNYPAGIRSLILDSPLPEFINIDEDELANFNEALKTIFAKSRTDSANQVLYGNLEERFKEYLSSIGNKTFSLAYQEKGTGKTLNIHYGRNELLDIIENSIFDFSSIKDVPAIINDFISGNHQPYMQAYFDGVFQSSGATSGMRLSVYCSDKMAYARDKVINQQYMLYPYMSGYHINDVYRGLCKCWQVPAIAPQTKMPFYADVPVLLAAGDTDPACRPLYNDMIHHYMPNSQRLLFTGKSHGPMLNTREGDVFIGAFLDNPYQKLTSTVKDVIVY